MRKSKAKAFQIKPEQEESINQWKPVEKVCFDGIVRRFKPSGYDCKHIRIGYGGVKCAAYPTEPRHGCPAMGCPWRCSRFELKKDNAGEGTYGNKLRVSGAGISPV